MCGCGNYETNLHVFLELCRFGTIASKGASGSLRCFPLVQSYSTLRATHQWRVPYGGLTPDGDYLSLMSWCISGCPPGPLNCRGFLRNISHESSSRYQYSHCRILPMLTSLWYICIHPDMYIGSVPAIMGTCLVYIRVSCSTLAWAHVFCVYVWSWATLMTIMGLF